MIRIIDGFPDTQTDRVADLFWTAFAGKLNTLLGPEDDAYSYLARVLCADYAISALDDGGHVVGVAGIKVDDGGLVGGDLSDLQAIYGMYGGLWRGILLSMLERPVKPDELLMDGIFVSTDARGMGVGTQLLDGVVARAHKMNKQRIRLDVIAENPRAKALYTRYGFSARRTKSIGPMRHIFGFREATEMILDL